MKKILITGHGGYVGYNLVSTISSRNYQITGLSRTIQKNIKFKQIRKNILRLGPSDVNKNSCIIHLAAINDLEYCQKNPIECFRINTLGTQNVLETARKKDCSIIYLSTSHVFGTPVKLPIGEGHPRNAT